jgi:hypothetical protein
MCWKITKTLSPTGKQARLSISGEIPQMSRFVSSIYVRKYVVVIFQTGEEEGPLLNEAVASITIARSPFTHRTVREFW